RDRMPLVEIGVPNEIASIFHMIRASYIDYRLVLRLFSLANVRAPRMLAGCAEHVAGRTGIHEQLHAHLILRRALQRLPCRAAVSAVEHTARRRLRLGQA